MRNHMRPRNWRCGGRAIAGWWMDERRRRTMLGGGSWEAKSASGDRKHIGGSVPGTGTAPGRAGWTAERRSCNADGNPQRGWMARQKLGVGRDEEGYGFTEAAAVKPNGSLACPGCPHCGTPRATRQGRNTLFGRSRNLHGRGIRGGPIVCSLTQPLRSWRLLKSALRMECRTPAN